MWMPNRASPRAQRTPSVHSVVSVHSNTSRPQSMTSVQNRRQSRGYESDTASDITLEEVTTPSRRAVDSSLPPMWQVQRQQTASATMRTSQKLGSEMDSNNAAPAPLRKQFQHPRERVERPIDDDATSRSSTLDGLEDMDYPEKLHKPIMVTRIKSLDNEPASPIPAPHIPGPLESQLAALMSKLIYLEHKDPAMSVSPEEFQEMKARLKTLEDEKKTWWKRHEAIWALRDEDVENNIKIRGMLAKARRELEGMTKLRDEDLLNVQIVRSKLSDKTRELERLQAQNGRSSPSRQARPGSVFERRGTTDLFTAAKIAALEQRALELEKRNSDLVSQLESSRSGMPIDDLNRVTAHQAWKDTVSDMEAKVRAKDAEIARLRVGGSSTGGTSAGPGMDWYRIEALLEEHASYRESVGGKLQALRSEKETLQKDLHRKENECQSLELRVQTLQRRVTVL